jgi:sporulation protein YlmC with PRC-barrel domain
MKLTDESFRGRVVISSDGVALGEIAHLYVDSDTWRVRSFEVRLRKDAADRVGVHRSLFHSSTIEIPTELVQSVGDAVILAVTAEALRPSPPPQQPSAPPPH